MPAPAEDFRRDRRDVERASALLAKRAAVVDSVHRAPTRLVSTFLFTFFPDKGDRFFPPEVEVRATARGVCSGSDIDTNFVVTPSGIRTGEESLQFTQELSKQVRARRRDLRVAPKVVNIRCHHSKSVAETGSLQQ